MARIFSDWLKAYTDFTSSSEAPGEFHFWTGVSTIAATLQRKVWKDERLFKWTPNFYIVFVGPAGTVTKSTTLDIGYQLLAQVDGIHFGPDSMTWHGLAKRFQESFEYVEYINGTGETKRFGMSALTCSVSELGTFLRPDDKGLISFLTDVWDGKERAFRHITKDSGNIEIENAWLNIIGGTTPEWIQNNFPVSMLMEGIGSRVIFVYGEQKRHLTPYPSQAPAMRNYYQKRDELVLDLKEIAQLKGPFEMTPDAYQWGSDWYAKHHASRGTNVASSRYSGYLGRKQTHMHKLAMVLAVARRDRLVIEAIDLQAAEQILNDTEKSMIRVFENVGIVDQAKHVAEIVQLVRTYKWLSSNDLLRLTYNNIAEKDLKHALSVAVQGGLLEVETRNNQRGVKPKQGTIH